MRYVLVLLTLTAAVVPAVDGVAEGPRTERAVERYKEREKRINQTPRVQREAQRAKEKSEQTAKSPRTQRLAERAQEKTVPWFRDPQHQVMEPVQNWKALKNQNIVMQKYDYSCGPACLATVIKYYWGDKATEDQFLVSVLAVMTPEQVKDRIAKGLTLTDLRRAAVINGYMSSMGRRTMAQLAEVKIPVIVHIKKGEYDHFVVYRGIVDDRVFLADPIRGNIRMPCAQFRQEWTDGVILVVVKRGVKPPENSPLMCLPPSPAQREMQAARSAFFHAPSSLQNVISP